MKTLLLLRHGKSSRDDPTLADHERPLNGRGKQAARRMGRLLRDEDIVPDLFVSSPAVRARKTAEKAAKQCGYSRAIELDERLYLSNSKAHFAVVREALPDRDRVLIVGHNPGLSDFLDALTGAAEEMPTAALALIELPISHWKDLSEQTRGKLVALWKPRELE